MKTSEVLHKAADLIEERGWDHGVGWEKGDRRPLCLEGGIMAAAGLVEGDIYGRRDPLAAWNECPAYRAVADYLGRSGFLYDWNDHRDRTATEVVATLRAAALIEAAKETEVVVVTAREGVAV